MTEKSSLNPIVIFDIDGVVRDVGNSYRRALADTVEHFTNTAYRPTPGDIDQLKSEGLWNNDWEASQEFIYRHFESLGKTRQQLQLDYKTIVDFFQSRYRGTDPENWTGYICDEPLLLQPSYLEQLTESKISWGFFSGATRASATYVLHKRLGLQSPVLIAMEDAPGKPDPTGLFATMGLLETEINNTSAIIYVGDTVADMYTVRKAREMHPEWNCIGVGILPPHVQETAAHSHAYGETLLAAGAAIVLSNVEQLNPAKIAELITKK